MTRWLRCLLTTAVLVGGGCAETPPPPTLCPTAPVGGSILIGEDPAFVVSVPDAWSVVSTPRGLLASSPLDDAFVLVGTEVVESIAEVVPQADVDRGQETPVGVRGMIGAEQAQARATVDGVAFTLRLVHASGQRGFALFGFAEGAASQSLRALEDAHASLKRAPRSGPATPSDTQPSHDESFEVPDP